jgi:hypothetical protein
VSPENPSRATASSSTPDTAVGKYLVLSFVDGGEYVAFFFSLILFYIHVSCCGQTNLFDPHVLNEMASLCSYN